eukprot:scaffold17694_cov118-Isochrysis_galbana.AAC.3
MRGLAPAHSEMRRDRAARARARVACGARTHACTNAGMMRAARVKAGAPKYGASRPGRGRPKPQTARHESSARRPRDRHILLQLTPLTRASPSPGPLLCRALAPSKYQVASYGSSAPRVRKNTKPREPRQRERRRRAPLAPAPSHE